MILKGEKEREREREGGERDTHKDRDRDIQVREKHPSIFSRTCPHHGPNPQPRYVC